MRLPPDVLEHYQQGLERDRLSSGAGRLEALRTEQLLQGWLPSPPAIVLDVGGAAGRYARALVDRRSGSSMDQLSDADFPEPAFFRPSHWATRVF